MRATSDSPADGASGEHAPDDPNEALRDEEELVAPEESSDWLPEAEPTGGEAPSP